MPPAETQGGPPSGANDVNKSDTPLLDNSTSPRKKGKKNRLELLLHDSDDDPDIVGVTQEMDDAEFLQKIPPDFKAAANHGKANRVRNLTKQALLVKDIRIEQAIEEGKVCRCCEKYIDTDQCRLGICASAAAVSASLGSGVSMYFNIKNGFSLLLFIMTIFMTAPCVYLGWYISYDIPTDTKIVGAVQLPDNLIKDTEFVAKFAA
jgi:hypothetical protein